MQHSVHHARFTVGPSRRLKQALYALHALALIASLISGLAWPLKGWACLLLSVHLYFARRNLARGQVEIRYTDGAGWHLADEPVVVLPSTVLTPFAVWLHVKPAASRMKAVLIVRDALPDAEFRRLIVKLKISAA